MSTQEHAPPDMPQGQSRNADLSRLPSCPRKPRISLGQWRIFQAVVDYGGFSQASEVLHLSQSAISYSLAKLQGQLGVPVLEIEGRKAHLTRMGHAILERSRQLTKKANEIEAFAATLERGWEPEIHLVVDFSFPANLLMHALGKFAQTGNGTAVQLREIPDLSMTELLRKDSVDLAISTQLPKGFLGDPLMEVEYIAVAAPGHPLLSLRKELTKADLEETTQIVIYDFDTPERRNGAGQWLHQGVCWYVARFEMAVAAVEAGHGFAWLLKHRIQDLLDRRVLMPLPLRGGPIRKATLYLIYGGYRASNPGPAVCHLVEVLRKAITEENTHKGNVAEARRATLGPEGP
jgi:DNA-binding transcriptional LysR family regulator